MNIDDIRKYAGVYGSRLEEVFSRIDDGPEFDERKVERDLESIRLSCSSEVYHFYKELWTHYHTGD
jgi:hypothetical protein